MTFEQTIQIRDRVRKRRAQNVENISREISRLVEIAPTLGIQRMVLFGSLARGDQVGTSDIDILIIQHHSDREDYLQQARRYYPYFDLPIGVDLLVTTQEQIDRRMSEGDPWARQIWQESLPLEID